MELNPSKELCHYCHSSLYRLSGGHVKCSRCGKKYSPDKLRRINALIQLFCEDTNALEASRRLEITYVTALKHYQKLRRLCAEHSELQYHLHRTQETQYEEYLYLEKSKRNKKGAIFEARNILAFGYAERVYTLLMPSLTMFKQQFVEDDLEDVYLREFSKFMRTSKIIKISRHDNIIERFLHYFEQFITPYKGVSEAHFPYYLKEAEFKFNTPVDERAKILERLWFRPNDSDI